MRTFLSWFLALVLAFFFVGLLPSNAVALTTTVPDDYSTIQMAIDASVPGNTIFVRSGTYYEHVIVNKSLTLQGEGRETTIIDGSGTGKVVKIDSASNVFISGFTIRNSGFSEASWDKDSGVVLWYASNSLISDCIITANGLDGLYSYGSSYNTIRNCDFSYNEIPPSPEGVVGTIHLRYSSNNTIADNNIYSNNSHNSITVRSGSNSTTVTGNHIYSNQSGGVHVGWSSDCNISNNIVHDNLGSSAAFDAASYNQVIDNIIYSNGAGIKTVYFSNFNTFIGNVIRGNGVGIILGGYNLSSYGHVFYHNDVMSNTVQVLIQVGGSNTWDNGYPAGGNYWTDYTGVDSDDDGIGDTPYEINGSNRDNYPLMKPHNSIPIFIDIKPGSDPNCFHINGHGVVPVAIHGSADFDVYHIDTATLLFAGMEVRVRGNRGPLCAYEYSNDDVFLDLVCHFEDDPAVWKPGEGEACVAGNLLEEFYGTAIEGCDLICLVP